MNDLIETIFSGFAVNNIAVPVAYLVYDGTATTYIVYQAMDADGEYHGDDTLLGYAEYYDIDIYAHKNGSFGGNYYSIANAVKTLMQENGFMFEPERTSADMFEPDTGYYHKTLNFSILRQGV